MSYLYYNTTEKEIKDILKENGRFTDEEVKLAFEAGIDVFSKENYIFEFVEEIKALENENIITDLENEFKINDLYDISEKKQIEIGKYLYGRNYSEHIEVDGEELKLFIPENFDDSLLEEELETDEEQTDEEDDYMSEEEREAWDDYIEYINK